MVNAGYVGRNQEEVRRHIEELAAKGIPGPKRTPVLFPVVPRQILLDEQIEVYGNDTSGEVEYVLLIKDENTIYVGLGSDHTDRHLEETDIPRSKQICPNVISRSVWPLQEIEKHWDQLTIKADVVKDGQQTAYQEGKLELIMNPATLMDFVRNEIGGPLRDMVIYSGTIGLLTGEFVAGEKFKARLDDPVLGRSLNLAYGVLPLNYLAVD
ncbi:hypothetical protein AAU61_17505 [Desulfocarbo indianensis]|nr:hypothetical protein AAU61_17505 [Desulfocarbo indianensis]